MKESYECEVATHIGPESCGAAREGGVEALTRPLRCRKSRQWDTAALPGIAPALARARDKGKGGLQRDCNT
jgi:hypothetical protein